jgi:hypothetical protein
MSDPFEPESAMKSAQMWLADLDALLTSADLAMLEDLFTEDAHWRDVLAFTWEISSVGGVAAISERLAFTSEEIRPRSVRLAEEHTAPRSVRRAGRLVVEFYFNFTTAFGNATGLVRLVPDEAANSGMRACTLLTTLQELAGFEKLPPGVRPAGIGFERSGKENWLDRRATQTAFEEREPDVLIVGGGHNGLMVAAHLRHLDVDALIVDTFPRVGDNWRTRYHSLALHNQTDVVQMPFMRYPDNFPSYLPKDKLANWFETYADSMELNYWTDTTFSAGSYDVDTGRWTATLTSSDGSVRTLHPQHVVIATGGVGGTPNIPHLHGIEDYSGEVVHTSQFTSGANYAGRNVLIVGVGTSAHDVALDLHHNGAKATMLQRSPTIVINVDSADMTYGQYIDGTPLDEADLIGLANFIYPLMKTSLQELTVLTNERDREILEALTAVGLRIDSGEDDTGWLMKFFRYGGGYYINVGCSEVVASGAIAIQQAEDVKTFVGAGLELNDGQVLPYDAVILATGYLDQQSQVRDLFGEQVADKVGKVLGFDDRMEIRNAWQQTPQKGLWFQVGGIPQGRSYSRFLALQLKAALEGLLPGYRPVEEPDE